jgi:hypothetical protein
MIDNFPAFWMRNVCSHSVESVLSLYFPDAVLVPTYDQEVLQGYAQLRGYFRSFLSKDRLCGRIDEMVEQHVGRVKILSGIYTFRFYERRKVKVVRARFTFVLAPIDETSNPQWRIVTQHSSEMPA